MKAGTAGGDRASLEPRLWERVGELADRAPRISDLKYHKLQLIGASRIRARGESVPTELRMAERAAAAVALAAKPLITRIRALTDAPILVMKGPEAAGYWQNPRQRPWKDLDLLVEDADALQAALLAAGFVELEEPEPFTEIHHHCPLAYPGLPLAIEIHKRPHFPGRRAPSFEELADAAVPSSLDVAGVFAPSAVHHTVLLAGHAWEHESLSRVGFAADIASTWLASDADAVTETARAWGAARMWSATSRAVDELLFEPPSGGRTPIWRRHLHESRERTVFEAHVERLTGPLTAAPTVAAPVAATRALLKTLRPVPGETWNEKLRRSRDAVSNASLRQSDHDHHGRQADDPRGS